MERVRQQFYGRERLQREIVAGVLAPQPGSFSLVGSKLAGKSRLLDHLASPEGALLNEDLADWRPYAFQDANRIVIARVDCDWQDAQDDLLGHIARQMTYQVREVDRIPLEWPIVEQERAQSRRIWQIARQLNQMGYRLVLFMDNFDAVFENQLLNPATVDELRPLTLEMALVVATEQPLHDLDRELAASPLFNVMTQLFIGLIEPDAAQQWLNSYCQRYPAVDALREQLLLLTGQHPFLIARISDILTEIEQMLLPGQRLNHDFLPLIRLRLAEHGRLLFVTMWRNLQSPPRRIDTRSMQLFLERLLEGPVAMDQVGAEYFVPLNWLINQAMVVYGPRGYELFSPLFGEFLSSRVHTVAATAPQATPVSRSVTAAPSGEPPLFEQLTKTESVLLRYFQAHSNRVISPEQLLTDVWRRPDASPRRVQEAIRRLRLQLEEAQPPVGNIENERGRGYRFVPARK
jgi:hypothetical protein